MSFNLDGKTIAISNIKGEVLIYDLRYTSQRYKSLVGHKKSPVIILNSQRKIEITSNSIIKEEFRLRDCY